MKEEKNSQTLTLNKEFKRAYYQGKSKATPYFIFYKIKRFFLSFMIYYLWVKKYEKISLLIRGNFSFTGKWMF